MDSDARQACCAPTNLPIQEADDFGPFFMCQFQTTNEVAKAVELLPPP